MKAVLAAALMLVTTATPTLADGATGLLFLTLEGARERGYGGAGWMEAPHGLDSAGPVFSVELGTKRDWRGQGSGMAGWRFVSGRTTTTLLGGVEIGARARPKVSADLWWDNAGWMATARGEATPDYVSWRTAGGWRGRETLPWVGPEVAFKDDGLRLGAHATGIKLPGSFQARASTGWTTGNVYGELSLWRRF